MTPVNLLVMLVVCSLAVASCRSATGRSFGQQIDDKVISSTHLGVERLTGTVETAPSSGPRPRASPPRRRA